MRTYQKEGYYKKTTELNRQDSPSTGSITCYNGIVEYSDGPEQCMFIEVADCHNKARLHKSHTDTVEDFIEKVRLMEQSLAEFRHHLERFTPSSHWFTDEALRKS